MNKIFIVIPCYNPPSAFKDFYNQLRPLLTDDINCLIVNDGSTADKLAYINEVICQDPYTMLVSYPENQGKGSAIKTGITFLLNSYPKLADFYIITADCDGQHSVEDINKFINYIIEASDDKLMLGVRTFSGWVPFHSKIGHAISNYLYNKLFKIKLPDVHCGLRSFNKNIAVKLLELPYNRFDFECAMIPYCNKLFGITPIEIAGIYNKQNYSTTYNMRDWFLNLKTLFQINSFLKSKN